MDAFERVIGYFPGCDQKEMEALSLHKPTEIRVRTGRRTKVIWLGGEAEIGGTVAASEILSLISRMLDHSIYAWEDELGQGYFSLPYGVRVGVSGRFSMDYDKTRMVAPSSLLIRIAREAKGCIERLRPFLLKNGCAVNTIFLSPPGMGKTTYLRDACRFLSDAGKEISVVDERGEIAAMRNGISQLDAGSRTDVCEGIAKARAIVMLARSMAPHVIVVDEIGSREDAWAISEAARMGIGILASAHTSSVTDALEREMIGSIMTSGILKNACVLGDQIGNIKGIYVFSEGKWRLKSSSEGL